MRERPILFSGPMVRAILDGRKSMTRRVIKPQPEMEFDGEMLPDGTGYGGWAPVLPPWSKWPYRVGDRLWVRETWATNEPIWDDDKAESFAVPAMVDRSMIIYRAVCEKNRKWRPSIFMPRWASRITLEITGVRVERVQDITEGDAREEGITDGGCLNCGEHEPCGCDNPQPDARDAFIWLWDSINKKRGYGWHVNPWVWVIEFKRVEVDHER
jgi:hypothetical protein